MVLRTCTVAVKDVRDVEHSVEVTAETLYEAIAAALAALAGQLGRGNWPGVHFRRCSCPAATRKARNQNEGLCLMARTARTFSRRGRAEAKAGENMGKTTRGD